MCWRASREGGKAGAGKLVRLAMDSPFFSAMILICTLIISTEPVEKEEKKGDSKSKCSSDALVLSIRPFALQLSWSLICPFFPA